MKSSSSRTASAGLEQLRESLRRLQGLMKTASLGTIGDPAKVDLNAGHVAFELGRIADKLEGLQASIDETLEREGRELAARVAEYVLMCFRTRDPSFDLEPARLGLAKGREMQICDVVHEVAEAVVELFSCDSPEIAGVVASEEEDASSEATGGVGGE